MKHIYTLLMVCALFCGSARIAAQPLYPFPSPGLVQTEVYHWDWTQMFVPGNFSFVHQGDTVIASDTMAKFSWLPVGSSTPWYTWYNNGKVYWIGHVPVPNPANGTLIYDFTLGVGDTFFCPLGFVIYGTYTVTTVSTITLANSQVRKYMELVQGNDTLRWIDGIGDIEHGFLYSSDGEGGYEEFICARDSAGPLYAAPASSFYCDENDPVPVSGPNTCAPFVYNAQVYGTSCLGCDGAITISNITGGAGGYTFHWSTGATTQNAYNLCQGPVTVTIYDANGDSCSRTFVVGQSLINLNLTHGSTACAFSDTLCVAPTGGNPPYYYQWSTGQNSPCIVINTNGTYTIQAVDVNGCVVTQTITINNPQPLNVTTAQTAPTCSTCCDGNIALNITGGIPPYAVNGFPSWPTPNNFCAGWYNYCVTDSLDCMWCDSVLLLGPMSVLPAPELRFRMYPNPAQEYVIIETTGLADRVVLYDLSGKVIREYALPSTQNRIDVSGVADGIYFVKVANHVERLVICRE